MNKYNTTQRIAYTALFSALAIVANIFSVPLMGSNYLSFVMIPTYIAGIYFGLWIGGAVGLVGDIVGYLIHPTGVFNPLIILSTVLLGLIPAIIWKATRKTSWSTITKLALTLLATTVIVTSGLNTLALWLMYGMGTKTYWVYLIGRLPFQLIMVLVNGIVIYLIIASKVLDKLLSRQHYHIS